MNEQNKADDKRGRLTGKQWFLQRERDEGGDNDSESFGEDEGEDKEEEEDEQGEDDAFDYEDDGEYSYLKILCIPWQEVQHCRSLSLRITEMIAVRISNGSS